MRRLSLVVPALLVATSACSSPDPAPRPDPPSAPPVVDRSGGLGSLDLVEALAGRELETIADGPWRTRRVAANAARETAGSTDARWGDDVAGEPLERARGRLGGGGGPGAPAKSEAPSTKRPAAKPSDGSHGAGPAAGVRPSPSPDPGVESESGVAADGEYLDAGDKSGALRSELRLADTPVEHAAEAKTLRAGKTDDNADFDAYLEFLSTWVEREEIQSLYQPTDVAGRRTLRVTDATGRPVPGAVVAVIDEAADRVLWRGTTYGDGVVQYYPKLVPGAQAEPGAPLLIEAYVRDGAEGPTGVRLEWDGTGDVVDIALTETVPAPETLALDVCFVIDTTGSMSDEIASIKASLLKVTEQLRGLGREFDLRYSAVLYRDVGDEYVTATHPFTSDITAFDGALRGVRAAGGGDTPESLNQALAQAVDGVEWRPGAAKVAFLVADAEPHMDYDGDVPYGDSARAALAKGIRVHAVAASGLSAVGTLAFRQIAQLARGKFVFIEYGGAAASAESHGVAGKVDSDNLEDILFEQIRDELATFGRNP